MLKRHNACDGCGRQIFQGEKVTALLTEMDVEISGYEEEELRLKVSKDAINERTIKVFCFNCLNLRDYIEVKIG